MVRVTSVWLASSSPNFGSLVLISVTFCLTVTAMTMTDTPAHIADAVLARLKQLGKWGDLTTIAERSEVSDNTWRPLLKEGRTPKRHGTRVAIARFLEWDPDALAMLEDGTDPATIEGRRYDVGESLFGTIVTEEQSPADTAVMVQQLSHRVVYLGSQVKAMSGRLDEHDTKLETVDRMSEKLDQVLAVLRERAEAAVAVVAPDDAARPAPRPRPRKPRSAGGVGPAP